MRDFIRRWKDLNELIEILLSQNIQTYIIGGFVKDHIEHSLPRDVDIVVDCDDENLDSLITSQVYAYTKNFFHGYKLKLSLDVDIWTLTSHYGINEAELKDALFYNYNSIVYNVNTDSIDREYYDKCINEQKLDFIGSRELINENPAYVLNSLRAYILAYEKGFNLSDSVMEYLKDKNVSITLLKKEYERHYHAKMEQNLCNYIENFIKHNK